MRAAALEGGANATDAPRVRVRALETFRRRAALRMPFRFGTTTVSELSILYLRAELETSDGRAVRGVSASVLSPLWFDKSPERPPQEKEQRLLLSVAAAARSYVEAGARHAHGLHLEAGGAAAALLGGLGLDALQASFGVALCDAAVVDGLCRAAGVTFHGALRSDLLGLGPDYADWPAAPRESIALRHTVGLADPLEARDPGGPGADGLPRTLEEVVREYRPRFFKLKIGADVAEARERLARVTAVLRREAPDYRLTLDGNEQLVSAAELPVLVDGLAGDPELAEAWARTLWLEQPLARKVALEGSVRDALREVGGRVPILIDESDGSDASVERALDLGYAGVSAKICKGVFRSLHSQRCVQAWNAAGKGPALLASEDLTCPALVPLHQDLCVAAALGIEHTERNAQHYLRGLDHLSEGEREQALADYPSLYERRAGGLVSMRVEDGSIATREVAAVGFGVAREPDWQALEALDLGEH